MGWRGVMRLPALLASVLDPGRFSRSTVRKNSTLVDSIDYPSYIDLALAFRRLCSMHRSSDTIAPGGICRGQLSVARAKPRSRRFDRVRRPAVGQLLVFLIDPVLRDSPIDSGSASEAPLRPLSETSGTSETSANNDGTACTRPLTHRAEERAVSFVSAFSGQCPAAPVPEGTEASMA